MADKKPLNIYQRMSAVMADVNYILKDDKRVDNKYKFVSHDAVAARLHPALVKHGIIIIPTVDNWEAIPIEIIRRDGKKSVALRVELNMTIEFVNVDDPADRYSVKSFGFGIDPQDKGPGKAMSYALKYGLIKAILVETGEDADKDSIDHAEPEYISDEQAQTIMALISETGTDIKKFCRFMKADAVAYIPVAMYKKAISALEMKKAKIDKQEQNPLEAG